MSRWRYYYRPDILTIVVASGISGVIMSKILFDRNDPFSYKAITQIFKERLPEAIKKEKQNAKYEEINRMDYDELKKHTNRKH